MIDHTKKCSKCGEVKLLGEFGIKPRGKVGIQPYCKFCERQQEEKWKSLLKRKLK